MRSIHVLQSHSYITYLLTPWCRVLLEKLTGLQLGKKFPAFHGTRRFITALTSVRYPACERFLTNFLQWEVVITSPNPQAGGPPLVGCPRLLIQFIRSYPPYQRLFLYPHPEDTPCHGDKDPFIYYSYIFIMLLNVLTLLGLKYVAYYTQFSQRKAWLYKAKLFHEPNR